jgi:hypothetical protein
MGDFESRDLKGYSERTIHSDQIKTGHIKAGSSGIYEQLKELTDRLNNIRENSREISVKLGGNRPTEACGMEQGGEIPSIQSILSALIQNASETQDYLHHANKTIGEL